MILLVAQYNEDISWTKLIKDKVVIYNKEKGNWGREAECYIRYIIENYKEIDDTAFTQANPFKHCPDYFNKYNKFGFYGEKHISDLWGKPDHWCRIDIEKFCKKLDLECEKNLTFTAGAIFTIKKETILKHSLLFYKNLYNLIKQNDDAPWILERIWHIIF